MTLPCPTCGMAIEDHDEVAAEACYASYRKRLAWLNNESHRRSPSWRAWDGRLVSE